MNTPEEQPAPAQEKVDGLEASRRKWAEEKASGQWAEAERWQEQRRRQEEQRRAAKGTK